MKPYFFWSSVGHEKGSQMERCGSSRAERIGVTDEHYVRCCGRSHTGLLPCKEAEGLPQNCSTTATFDTPRARRRMTVLKLVIRKKDKTQTRHQTAISNDKKRLQLHRPKVTKWTRGLQSSESSESSRFVDQQNFQQMKQ